MSTITALNAVLSCDTSSFTTTIGRATGKLVDLKDVGRSVWEETRTPLEKYQAQLSQLSGLLRRAQIDQETYGRAAQQAAAQTRAAFQSSPAGRILQQTRTPLENYRAQLAEANQLLQSGQINLQTYGRHVNALGQSFRTTSLQTSALGQALAGIGINVAAFANPVTAAIAVIGTGTAAVTALGAAATAAGIKGVKLAAEYEQVNVAFTTMLGSAETARQVLDELTQFAAATPFEFPELADAARKLAAFGVRADQLVPSLRAIGDVAAGISEPIGEIAEIYGKARTQGRLFGDDIRQLGGRGIPIVAELAKQFGVAENAIPKMVEAGKVGFDNLQRAFISLTSEGGRFEGMMDNQSQILTGLASTLNDNVNLALRDFGIHLSEDLDLKGKLQSLIELTDVLQADVAPTLALVTRLSLDFGTAVATGFGALDTIPEKYAAVDFLRSLHAGLIGIDTFVAQMTGDQERLNKDIAAAAELGAKALGKKPESTAGKMEVEAHGADTSAQEKAVKDLQGYLKSLDEQFSSLGLSSQEAKLKEFLDLAKQGEIKLDATDLDEARQKLAELQKAQAGQKATDFTRDLEKQIALLGESGNAAKFYELAQQGATQADLAAAKALDTKLAALKHQKAAAELVTDLQKRIALVGQSGEAAKFYDLQKKGATDAELATARLLTSTLAQKEALQSVADEMRKVALHAKVFTADLAAPFQQLYLDLRELGQQLKAGKITQQQFDAAREQGMHLAQQANSIYDSTRKPLEKYKEDLAQLQELLSRGFIDEETFNRAARKGLKSLDNESARNPSAIEKGSAEAYSAILKATDRGTRESYEAKQLTEQARTNAILTRMERQQKQRGPQVQIRDMPR